MNADEQAIRNLVAQWHRATAAGDVDTVLGLMDEGAVFLVAGRPPMKGRSTFEKGLLLDDAYRSDDAAFRRRRQRALGQRALDFAQAGERIMGPRARCEPLACIR